MIALALATGIAPGVWAEEGARSIETATQMLEQESKRRR